MIGARVINPNKGTVVVDQNYSNLCLRSYDRFQINGSGSYVTIERTFTTTVGVVAFGEGNVSVAGISRSGDQCVYSLTAAPGTWVRAYVFDVSEYGQRYYDNPVGIRIRNPSNGQLMFDSRNKYLKLLHFLQGEGTSGTSQNFHFPGRSVAAIQGSAFSTWFIVGPEFGPFFSTTIWASMQANGDRFTTAHEQTQVPIGPPPMVGPRSAVQPNWNYLIIDVTDY